MSAYDGAMLDGCNLDIQSSIVTEYCDHRAEGEHMSLVRIK